jgi:hypothetical protein
MACSGQADAAGQMQVPGGCSCCCQGAAAAPFTPAPGRSHPVWDHKEQGRRNRCTCPATAAASPATSAVPSPHHTQLPWYSNPRRMEVTHGRGFHIHTPQHTEERHSTRPQLHTQQHTHMCGWPCNRTGTAAQGSTQHGCDTTPSACLSAQLAEPLDVPALERPITPRCPHS